MRIFLSRQGIAGNSPGKRICAASSFAFATLSFASYFS